MKDTVIRTLEAKDNAALAAIIRGALEEFGAARPGTVYFDKTTDDLYGLFTGMPRSVYYVAERGGKVIGGAGIFPTEGLPGDTCELVKMYLQPVARGIGLGKRLIKDCIAFAKEAGYATIYLESMPELKQALKTYEKFGFEYLDAALGNSGHTGCSLWMAGKVEGLVH